MTDRSAVGKRSRRKGVTYERKIARMFREAGFPMVRTPLSGGWRGSLVGDLIPDPDCPDAKPFVVECKKGAQVPALDDLFCSTSQLVKWYGENESKAAEYVAHPEGHNPWHPDRFFPVLVFARDRGRDFTMCRWPMLDGLEMGTARVKWGSLVVLPLERFLLVVRRLYEMREMRARPER